MTNAKFPANTEVYVSVGYFRFEGTHPHTFEFWAEEIDTDILDLSPIETYGATNSRGAIACYNMASSSVTLGDIIAARDSIIECNTHHDVSRSGYLTEGYLYDSEDCSYTYFSDLDEDLQEDIINSGGDYFKEDDKGYHEFIPTFKIGEEWIKFLNYAIDKLTSLIELEDVH